MSLRKLITMREALSRPDYFADLLAGPSWDAWRVLLIAVVGEELTPDERILFESLTGREREPGAPVSEFWGICGRRSGKTRATSVLAAYYAACCDHRFILGPGERGQLPVMAVNTAQAAQAFRFISGAFENSPNLQGLILNKTADVLSLTTGVDIVVRPASFRTVRGSTAVAAILDETAFFQTDDAANPDRAIIDALLPSLATTGGPLISISSPYARRGEVFETYKRHFGAAGDPLILVAKGATRTFNPTIKQAVVDRALERDPASGAAEWLGEFRPDLDTFVTSETVRNCVEDGVFERAPDHDRHSYFGFIDAAGGSGQDSFTAAISHIEDGLSVLDLIHEVKPPFSPEAVVADLSETLKRYNVYHVTADKWGSEFVAEAFQRNGITCEQSAKPKSDLYREVLPLLMSAKASLLDHRKMIQQFVGLERRTARGGRDSIDHAPGGHDDIANAVSGALILASAGSWREVNARFAEKAEEFMLDMVLRATYRM